LKNPFQGRCWGRNLQKSAGRGRKSPQKVEVDEKSDRIGSERSKIVNRSAQNLEVAKKVEVAKILKKSTPKLRLNEDLGL